VHLLLGQWCERTTVICHLFHLQVMLPPCQLAEVFLTPLSHIGRGRKSGHLSLGGLSIPRRQHHEKLAVHLSWPSGAGIGCSSKQLHIIIANFSEQVVDNLLADVFTGIYCGWASVGSAIILW
jgi:hypothetical protein